MVIVIRNVRLRALSILLISERRKRIRPFDEQYDSPEIYEKNIAETYIFLLK